MAAIPNQAPWRQRGEQVAAVLMPLTTAAAMVGGVAPESLGMAPLISALLLLFMGSLRQEPLSGGMFVLMMLSLRIPLRGEDRYLPEELTLTDVLMVMITVAAAFSASRRFWRTFQTLFAILIPVSGAWVWGMGAVTIDGQPFAPGPFTAPQSAFVFGLSLCYALARLRSRLARGRGDPASRQPLFLALWLVCAALAGGLTLASGGIGSLLLVGAAVCTAGLGGQIHSSNFRQRRGIWTAGLLAGLLLSGTAAAIFIRPAPLLWSWDDTLRQRLSLLGCFFQAPFHNMEWFVHGVGFTNSSTWLCQSVRPGERMLHADNLFAQLTADTGMISLLVLGCLIIWMMRRMWRLSAREVDPVVLASLLGALYMLLDAQIESGWSESIVIQVLMGLQVAALCLPLEIKQ